LEHARDDGQALSNRDRQQSQVNHSEAGSPGISNIPRGAEGFTAEETKGMAARMVVPQGGMVGTMANALPTNQPSAPSIINQITIDARQATNPAAIKAAVEEVWNKKMKDILGSATIRLKTNPFGK